MTGNSNATQDLPVPMIRRVLGFIVGVYAGYILFWIFGQGSVPKISWFQPINAALYGLLGFVFLKYVFTGEFSWKRLFYHSAGWAFLCGIGYLGFEIVSSSQPNWGMVQQPLKVFLCVYCGLLFSTHPSVYKRL
jgi:hypothetical protein